MRKSDELDTDEVLNIAEEYARDRNIDDVVVASTGGETGVKARKPLTRKIKTGHSRAFHRV